MMLDNLLNREIEEEDPNASMENGTQCAMRLCVVRRSNAV